MTVMRRVETYFGLKHRLHSYAHYGLSYRMRFVLKWWKRLGLDTGNINIIDFNIVINWHTICTKLQAFLFGHAFLVIGISIAVDVCATGATNCKWHSYTHATNWNWVHLLNIKNHNIFVDSETLVTFFLLMIYAHVISKTSPVLLVSCPSPQQ